MNPGIYVKKIWFDDNVVELKIDSFDGNSLFSNKVYVGHQKMDDLITGLYTIKIMCKEESTIFNWDRSGLNTLAPHFMRVYTFKAVARFTLALPPNQKLKNLVSRMSLAKLCSILSLSLPCSTTLLLS